MSAVLRPLARRVLIVEDERLVADSLSLFLTAMGYAVRKTYHPGEAMAMCEGYQPDIALVDVSMAHLVGYDVARFIRDRRGKEALIVALVSKGQPPDRMRSRECGIDHTFVKSADLDLLLSFVAHRRPAAAQLRVL